MYRTYDRTKEKDPYITELVQFYKKSGDFIANLYESIDNNENLKRQQEIKDGFAF